jgi:hypothetical protein
MSMQQGPSPLTRRKKLMFGIISLAISATFTFAAAELLVRLKGIEPWIVQDIQLHVTPGGRLYTAHPLLGYAHLPGAFTVSLPNGYAFTVTHLANTLRVTRPLATYANARPQPEIWIFGCSFTHGWALQDQETYPWLLQESWPSYEVVNYGVGGYGTIHAMLRLRDALDQRPAPAVAVYAYAGFHDERNTFLRRRRKGVALWNKLGPLIQPYVRFDPAGHLHYAFAEVEYREFPLMRSSAFVHFLEMTYNEMEERLAHSHEVSKRLLLEMATLAKHYQVHLVLAGVMDDEPTHDMLTFAQAQGIMATDLSSDLDRDEYWDVPLGGGHPSALANRKYAERLDAFLRNEVLKNGRATAGGESR